MTPNGWIILACFAGLLLAASLHLLSASGHFPKHVRTPEIGTGAGPLILHSTIFLVLAAAFAGIWRILQVAPWYAAILAGGIAVLAGPLMLPNFSDRFVDGRLGLIVFAVLAYAALACMWLIR